MLTQKSFAVAGAGKLGALIVTALLEKGASVLILARTPKPVPLGAALAIVNYADTPTLTATLTGHHIEVVVSALAAEVLTTQQPLADAAKAAGVRLFVPSEFGPPSAGTAHAHLVPKDVTARYLDAIGLPYTRIYTGFFMSVLASGTGAGRVHAVGNADAPFSTTAEVDIAGYVAHVTTALSHADLAGRTLRIEGDRSSLRGLAAVLGVPLVVHEEPPPELPPLNGAYLAWMATGAASTGWDYDVGRDLGSAGRDNGLWPGHHWTTLVEFYRKL